MGLMLPAAGAAVVRARRRQVGPDLGQQAPRQGRIQAPVPRLLLLFWDLSHPVPRGHEWRVARAGWGVSPGVAGVAPRVTPGPSLAVSGAGQDEWDPALLPARSCTGAWAAGGVAEGGGRPCNAARNRERGVTPAPPSPSQLRTGAGCGLVPLPGAVAASEAQRRCTAAPCEPSSERPGGSTGLGPCRPTRAPASLSPESDRSTWEPVYP